MTSLSRRADFHSGNRTPAGLRAAISLVSDVEGRTVTDRKFTGALLVDQLFGTDSEATQQQLSADGEKMYAFDRVVRTIVVSGRLIDTVDTSALAAWLAFYEKARVSVAAKRARYVLLTIPGLTLRGSLVSASRSFSSTSPHEVPVTFTLLCFELQPDAAVEVIPGSDVFGRVSTEAAARLGLFPTEALDLVGFRLSSVRSTRAPAVDVSIFRG